MSGLLAATGSYAPAFVVGGVLAALGLVLTFVFDRLARGGEAA